MMPSSKLSKFAMDAKTPSQGYDSNWGIAFDLYTSQIMPYCQGTAINYFDEGNTSPS